MKLVCVSYSHQRAKEYAEAQIKHEQRETESKGKRKADTQPNIDIPVTKKSKVEQKNRLLDNIVVYVESSNSQSSSSSESSNDSESD